MARAIGRAKSGPTRAHVRRGDVVVVTKGREKGKRGKVKRLVGGGRVEVEKVMMIKRHTKPTQKNPRGGIVDQEGSIPLANVAMWCEKCAAGRRSRKVVDDSGSKTRVCVKCDNPFPTPGS
ncbi:MAG: 50S ribosomal protein L24 [Proteobacteria bacterium]|nr:50S ribosomal protein L24 [Pseudomonadota bacterium]